MKACPFCAEEIQDAAIVCKHCGRELAPAAAQTAAPTATPARSRAGFVLVLGGMIAAAFSSALIGLGVVAMWIGLARLLRGSAVIRWGGGFVGALLLAAVAGTASRSTSTTTPPRETAAPIGSTATLAADVPPVDSPRADGILSVPSSKWTGGLAGRSAIDDSQTVVFRLPAEDNIQAWLSTHLPVLIVRCQEDKTDVFVVTGTRLNNELGLFQQASVQIRLDDRTATTERWGESTDGEAIFSPSPVALARQLASGQRFRIRFTPFNASPQTAEFDIRGFDEHVGLIQQHCHWS